MNNNIQPEWNGYFSCISSKITLPMEDLLYFNLQKRLSSLGPSLRIAENHRQR